MDRIPGHERRVANVYRNGVGNQWAKHGYLRTHGWNAVLRIEKHGRELTWQALHLYFDLPPPWYKCPRPFHCVAADGAHLFRCKGACSRRALTFAGRLFACLRMLEAG